MLLLVNGKECDAALENSIAVSSSCTQYGLQRGDECWCELRMLGEDEQTK
jgi:hypothetical protein